ncbi:MAG: NifU family protein [Salinigranum sp.]
MTTRAEDDGSGTENGSGAENDRGAENHPADAATDDRTSARVETIAEDVAAFLRKNFPQIAMHGGNAAILDLDPETGEVWIRLSGACGGCGISPMTTRAIQTRLPVELADVTEVHVETADDGGRMADGLSGTRMDEGGRGGITDRT